MGDTFHPPIITRRNITWDHFRLLLTTLPVTPCPTLPVTPWPILPVTLPVTLPATLPATRPSSVIHPLTAVTPIPDLPLPLPVSARPTPSASPPTLHIRVTAIPDSLAIPAIPAIRDIPPTPDMAPLSGSVDTPLPVTASGVRPAPPGLPLHPTWSSAHPTETSSSWISTP